MTLDRCRVSESSAIRDQDAVELRYGAEKQPGCSPIASVDFAYLTHIVVKS